MTTSPQAAANDPSASGSTLSGLIRLARPQQWAKGAFVVIGPAYGVADGKSLTLGLVWAVIAAFLAFGFASSACYAFNDLRDAPADRLHPRKRRRPIASGLISPAAAVRLALAMLALSAASVSLAMLPRWSDLAVLSAPQGQTVLGLGILVALYVLNTTAYSLRFKHHAVLDVMSLSLGFVLRVLGGCAAAGVTPSPWLLNVTFFLSMFLAFGKRLGERRTMGSVEAAGAARPVQQAYTDELLRMTVVVTAVAALLTYAGYVQSQVVARGMDGIDVLWFTVLPATYGLLRSIVLLERGVYDDPTELVAHDRHCQTAGVLFVVLTAAAFAQKAG